MQYAYHIVIVSIKVFHCSFLLRDHVPEVAVSPRRYDEVYGVSNQRYGDFYVKQFIQANSKEYTKDLHYWPIVRIIHQWPMDSPYEW